MLGYNDNAAMQETQRKVLSEYFAKIAREQYPNREIECSVTTGPDHNLFNEISFTGLTNDEQAKIFKICNDGLGYFSTEDINRLLNKFNLIDARDLLTSIGFSHIDWEAKRIGHVFGYLVLPTLSL